MLIKETYYRRRSCVADALGRRVGVVPITVGVVIWDILRTLAWGTWRSNWIPMLDIFHNLN